MTEFDPALSKYPATRWRHAFDVETFNHLNGPAVCLVVQSHNWDEGKLRKECFHVV